MKTAINYYSAAFELVTEADRTYVEKVIITDFATESTEEFNGIDEFMVMLESCPKSRTIYTHDFKLPCKYVIQYLIDNKYKHTTGKFEKCEFTSFIDKTGSPFKIAFKNFNGKIIIFFDSQKLIPVKREEINAFVGRNGSETEILTYAIKKVKELGIDSITLSAAAIRDFKKLIGFKKFDSFYPKMSEQILRQLRRAYRGGFCWLNPEYTDIDTGEIDILDVNSMYPYVLSNKLMPYGAPTYFKGEPDRSPRHSLYVVNIQCCYDLKPGYVPTLLLKDNFNHLTGEYVTTSNGKIEILTLTNIDLKIFLKHYDVTNLEYLDGYYFRAENQNFKTFVEKWYKLKAQGKEEHDTCLYNIAKRMQVSLVGKFATRLYIQTKTPKKNDKGFELESSYVRNTERSYIPVAIFVNAYAREKTINIAQEAYAQIMPDGKRGYIYSDTDSAHIRTGVVTSAEIDAKKLGAWDIERYKNARYIRTKCYILNNFDEEIEIVCSGMPSGCREKVTFDNFRRGAEYTGARATISAGGGVKLIDTKFTLR